MSQQLELNFKKDLAKRYNNLSTVNPKNKK
jgi:hypothetical protein